MTEPEFNLVLNWAEKRLAVRIGPNRRAKWWGAFHAAKAERWAGAFVIIVEAFLPLSTRRIGKALHEAPLVRLNTLKDPPPYMSARGKEPDPYQPPAAIARESWKEGSPTDSEQENQEAMP